MSGTHCCDPQTPSVRAVLGNNGVFTAGYAVSLTLSVSDPSGNATNAANVSVIIRDSNGTQVDFTDSQGATLTGDELNPEQVTTGFYLYQWFIPDDVTPGTYTVVWSYDLDDVTYTEMDEVIVSSDGVSTDVYNDRMRVMRKSLRHLLCCATKVPIYGEQAKPSSDCRTFYFTRHNWNQAPSQTRIYRNGHTIINSGVTVDYTNGKITLDDTLSQAEWISADYQFDWFTDDQLTDYIIGAIQMYNHTTPFSQYSYVNLPDDAVRGVLYKAAADAIRELIMCLMFPEPEQLFGGPDRANNIRSQLETLKKNYEEDWKYVFDQKKRGPYPKIHIMTVPSYVLPGGRSRWFRYLFSGGSG